MLAPTESDRPSWFPTVRAKVEEGTKRTGYDENGRPIFQTMRDILSAEEIDDITWSLGDADTFYEKYLVGNIDRDMVFQDAHRVLQEAREIGDTLDNEAISDEELKMALDQAQLLRDQIRAGRGSVSVYIDLSPARDLGPFKYLAKAIGAQTLGQAHAGFRVTGTAVEWGCFPNPSLVWPSAKPKDIIASFLVASPTLSERLFSNLLLVPKIDVAKLSALEQFGLILSAPLLIPLLAVANAPQVMFRGGRVAAQSVRTLARTYTTGTFLPELQDGQLKAIAQVATRYNRTKKFSIASTNCQHFVRAVLSELHLPFNPKREIKAMQDRIFVGKADTCLLNVAETCAPPDVRSFSTFEELQEFAKREPFLQPIFQTMDAMDPTEGEHVRGQAVLQKTMEDVFNMPEMPERIRNDHLGIVAMIVCYKETFEVHQRALRYDDDTVLPLPVEPKLWRALEAFLHQCARQQIRESRK